MAVSTSVSSVQYAGNGTATTFAYSFKVFAEDELVVYLVNNSTGAATLQTRGTHYTVTGVGRDTGGNVVFTTAPASGVTVDIRTDMDLTQPTVFRNQGSFLPASHETAMDRIVREVIQVNRKAERAFQLPDVHDPAGLPDWSALLSLANRKGKYFGYFNPTTGAPELFTSIGATLLSQSVIGQFLYPQTAAEAAAGVTPTNYFVEPGNVRRYGAVGDGVTNDTAAIQAAINVAAAANSGRSVFIPAGRWVVFGTLIVASGVTVYGESSGSEYYVGSPYSTVSGSQLYKPNSGSSNGPIVQLDTGSSIRSLYLLHSKVNGATTGIVRFGGTATSDVCYYASAKDVRIYGEATADITGTNTCYGLFFPESDLATSRQRYFNSALGVTITNCDVGVRLSGQSNANIFTNMIVRQTYVAVDVDGGSSESVENVFSGLLYHNIGILPTTGSIGFRLRNSAKFNVFSGYTTEANGAAFSVDDTCTYNVFDGVENETTASHVPVRTAAGALTYNHHNDRGRSGYAPMRNNLGVSQMVLVEPSLTSNKFIFGRGSKMSVFRNVTGTLPQTNGGSFPQNLVASDADSRIIVQFDSTVFTRALHPSFFCKLKVFCAAPSNGGNSIAEVEFMYRPTSTTSAAGQLSVLRATRKGAAIAGLYFIDGVTGGTEFRIGLVGGGSTALAMNYVVVSMEIDALTYDSNSINFDEFSNFGFVSTAATANDVTDAIDLLTVADTTI